MAKCEVDNLVKKLYTDKKYSKIISRRQIKALTALVLAGKTRKTDLEAFTIKETRFRHEPGYAAQQEAIALKDQQEKEKRQKPKPIVIDESKMENRRGPNSESTNHTGGAYGADGLWADMLRVFGVVNNHYRPEQDGPRAKKINKLKSAGDSIIVVTDNELAEGKRLNGLLKNGTHDMNNRNLVQVYNSDTVFAVAPISNGKVNGGTGSATRLAESLNKEVFVLNTNDEKWYKSTDGIYEPIDYLPKMEGNFAAVGTRKLETYKIEDKETGKWDKDSEILDNADALLSVMKETVEASFSEEEDTGVPWEEPKIDTDPKYELFKDTFANEGQREALDALDEFIKEDAGSSTILLKGRGGVGKTSIIAKAITNSGVPEHKVIYVAPTNKATKVLKSMNKDSRSAHLTVAQLLSYRLDNGKLVKLRDKRGVEKESKIVGDMFNPTPKVVIIDEASMLTEAILEEINNEIIKSSENVKIIYMGDNVQLPPIKDANFQYESAVFSKHQGKDRLELTERMRQKAKSPILPITDELADAIESRVKDGKLVKGKEYDYKFNAKDEITTDENGEEHGVKYMQDTDSALKEFIKELKKDPENTRWIMFNNNDHKLGAEKTKKVRRELFGKIADTESIIVGEQLYVDSPLFEDEESLFSTGDELTVKKITKDVDTTVKVKVWNGKGYTVKLIPVNVDTIEVKDNLSGDITTAPIINEITIMSLSKDHKVHAAKIKQQLLKTSPAYILTSHKSQGSTYKTVYSDLGNILKYKKVERMQSAYVATSRASQKLVMVSAPKDSLKDTREYTGSINIWSNEKNGFKKLSNLNAGPFIATDEKTGDKTEFATIEGAYQYAKAIIAGDSAVAKEILDIKSGARAGLTAQKLGQKVNFKDNDTTAWDIGRSKIMEEILTEHYTNNDEAKKLLLDTAGKKLTHIGGREGYWTKEFPRLLMLTRDELEESTDEDATYSKDDQKIIDLLHATDISRVSKTSSEVWVMRNRQKGTNFGNPFYVTDDIKNPKPGDMKVDGSDNATLMYYKWITENILPDGADKEALDKRRNAIIKGLDEIKNA
ncbi:MAG: DUF1768 domain-containing protein, partial [Caldisericia bacterium]|nr:DUF1768 domain-containing protein [Caldisericia bacterium]